MEDSTFAYDVPYLQDNVPYLQDNVPYLQDNILLSGQPRRLGAGLSASHSL